MDCHNIMNCHDIDLQMFDHGNQARLLRDFKCHGVLVPKGFEFDGASCPRPLWWLIPPFKHTAAASCIHDYLCRVAKNPDDRLFADKVWYRMLRENPYVSNVRAWFGYRGVRIGAVFGYGAHYPHWTSPIRDLIMKFKRKVA